MICVECGCDMAPTHAYRKMKPEERVGLRDHRGRGLCSRCYAAARKADRLLDYERRTVDRDSLLEDVSILVLERGERCTATIAATVGVSKDALTKALLRAARAGDERANEARVHLPFMEAA